MKAIVTGMVVTYPVGGVAWDYGQYALGLERLGFEVYYLEDTGLPSYTYDPAVSGYVEDCSHGLRFLQESLGGLSPTLASRWHYRAVDGQTYGLPLEHIVDIAADADLFINVSGGCLLRDEYRRCPSKVFIDTDPGWNHFVIFPRWDTQPTEKRSQGFRGHDHFFTYAQRLGQSDCPLPSFDLSWHSTLPPVVLDCWHPRPPADCWTTVMMWNNYERPVAFYGVAYGAKELEFARVEDLPRRLATRHEVAIYSPHDDFPRERCQALGWSVVDGRRRSATAGTYRAYVEGSRGEFSVAKNIYVATRSGWFSCRSTCYLAAGRPVVVQDTSFADVIPVGDGLLAFSNVDEAKAAIETVESAYDHHCRAAHEVACTYFDANHVLADLLTQLGLE